MKNKIIVVMIAVLGLILLMFLPAVGEQQEDRIEVYTTVYPFELLTQEIGQDKVMVSNLYPVDSDVHSYEITAQDAKDIVDSDLVIYISEEDDKDIYDLSQTDTDDTVYVDLATDDTFIQNLDDDVLENGMLVNEHIWISPEKLMLVARVITDSLKEIDIQNSAYYEENYQSVIEKLSVIDEQYNSFASEQTKPLIITHDAYFYLAHDYGIDYSTLYGEHHDDEPSANKMISVVETIEQNNINSILVEQNDVNNTVMNEIAEQTGVQVEVINNMSSASSMEQFKEMDIYQLLEYNLEVMKESGL